uniref:Ankyrin repeat domain 33B n=1 Tax=Chelydra serpentina TaxID=8475 RepID=A0A8C3SYG2_CHESE
MSTPEMLQWHNVHTTDPSRGMTPREWACYTGRSEAAFLMQRLMDRPCPEQFCDQYKSEWPKMKELLAKAAEPKSCLQRISEGVRSAMSFRTSCGPQEDGVLDHMVRMTTSLSSPFIAISCRTVCPGSPPCVGKRTLAVQEILRKQRAQEIRSQDKDHAIISPLGNGLGYSQKGPGDHSNNEIVVSYLQEVDQG